MVEDGMRFPIETLAAKKKKRRAEAERRAQQYRARLEQLELEREHEINLLPLDQASQRAKALLEDSTRFLCSLVRVADEGRLIELAPYLGGFFRTFEYVEQVSPGALVLSHGQIGPSVTLPGLITIGSSGEHSCLVVRAGEETVYDVFEEGRDETDISLPTERFSSVYHCIVYFDRRRELLHPPPTAAQSE
jgi:hypothetical protein